MATAMKMPATTAMHHPLALDQNAHVLAQCRFLRRQHVIKRGADRPEKFSRFAE